MRLASYIQSEIQKTDASGVVIGMIGGGKMAKIHSKVLMKGFQNATLKAVSSRTMKSATILKEEFNYEYAYSDFHDMLDQHPEINALIISVSHEVSAKILKELIPYKKYILAEKPAAFSAQENSELSTLAQTHGTEVMVAVNRRFYDIYNDAYFEVARRGGVRSMLSEIHEPIWDYRGRSDFSDYVYSNWPIANSIHHIDLIRFFLGDVKKVNYSINKAPYHVQAHLELTLGTCIVNSLYNASAPSGFLLYGEGVSCDFLSKNRLSFLKSSVDIEHSKEELMYKPGIYGQMKYFISAVLNELPIAYPASNLDDHTKSLELIEKLYYSGQ